MSAFPDTGDVAVRIADGQLLPSPHVPFRDSKLTQILQPSLSGDARVVVIATINPSAAMVEETKSTLRVRHRPLLELLSVAC